MDRCIHRARICGILGPERLAAFETFDGTYKRDEVGAALALQPEIMPHLIALLEKVRLGPARYVRMPNDFGHVYAVELRSKKPRTRPPRKEKKR